MRAQAQDGGGLLASVVTVLVLALLGAMIYVNWPAPSVPACRTALSVERAYPTAEATP